MDLYVQHTQEATDFIKQKLGTFIPHVSLTLGSGVGKLAKLIQPVAEIPYKDIPHFPISTAPGHDGILIAGHLEGVPMLSFKGRKHFYEAAHEPHAIEQVVFPVHVAAHLGVQLYIATNAAGGLNPDFNVGDLMVIKSHIGFFLPNPLLGPHHDFGGNAYFQPMHEAYTEKYRTLFKSLSPDIHEGVYVAWSGRSFETQAESLLLKNLGADATGMSTIPEIIVATNRGMETLGVSVITNKITEDGTNATNQEEVLTILNSKETEEKLLTIFTSFFQKLKM